MSHRSLRARIEAYDLPYGLRPPLASPDAAASVTKEALVRQLANLKVLMDQNQKLRNKMKERGLLGQSGSSPLTEAPHDPQDLHIGNFGGEA